MNLCPDNYIETAISMKIKSLSSLFARPLSVATLLLCCASCYVNTNLPPKADVPWPAPHDGVFVAGSDTLRFNGDGETVSWHFAEGMDGLGLQGSGTYVFLFNGTAWRYDAAERFDIFSKEGRQLSFGLGVPGSCSDSVICLRRFDIEGRKSIEEVFLLRGDF